MQKITVIGDCVLEVTLPGGEATWPLELTGRPAGRLLNSAAMMAKRGHAVSYVGEAGRDRIGAMLIEFLDGCGVDTHCIDRFSEGTGVTATNFVVGDESGRVITNRCYPAGESFNATWPRIDADDVVVFGGHFAISDRTHQQVMELVNYASERKAIVVYLPGFVASLVPRITRVMPAILENLEVADVVITSTADLHHIFGRPTAAEAFHKNIEFYCDTLLNIDGEAGTVELFHGQLKEVLTGEGVGDALEKQSARIASFVDFIVDHSMTREDVRRMTSMDMEALAKRVAGKN